MNTNAAWSASRLDCHTLPATTLRKVVAPIPSGQTGLDASRQAQFSASIVILCEAFCVLSHHPGATRHLAGTVGNRTHPSGFGDRLASLGTFASMFVCLSRLSPLRVGCLRLAPIGTRFCCPAAPIYGQPACDCTSHGAGCGADGWT